MMSALGGGSPKADDSTDKFLECDSDKGEGVKKSENFADVICTCPLVRHIDNVHLLLRRREISRENEIGAR